jgi:hypothetical protein
MLTAGMPLEYFDDPRPLGEALNLVLRQVIVKMTTELKLRWAAGHVALAAQRPPQQA